MIQWVGCVVVSHYLLFSESYPFNMRTYMLSLISYFPFLHPSVLYYFTISFYICRLFTCPGLVFSSVHIPCSLVNQRWFGMINPIGFLMLVISAWLLSIVVTNYPLCDTGQIKSLLICQLWYYFGRGLFTYDFIHLLV